ncbi:MAG: permease-like cell division protein FtsX [Patescibacteria group bacterium]
MFHIFRTIKFALQNVYRNIWLTIMTVTILVLALFSVSIVISLNSVSEQLLTSVKQKVDISIAVLPDSTEDQAKSLVDRLQNLPEVKSATYVSSDEALEEFRIQHKDDADIQETLDLLEENPLPARIIISSNEIESFPSILSYLNQDENQKIVSTDTTEVEQAQIVIERLSSLSNQIQKIALGVTIIFIVISFLVVFNTIRIAIYTHKEEIGIMKLVGASNWFIRTPFLIEGMLYAFFATVITIAILAPVLGFLAPHLNDTFFASYNIDISQFFEAHLLSLIIYQFIGAAVLNMASASFAISRYLKV